MRTQLTLTTILVLLTASAGRADINMQYVTVGDPGNPNDSSTGLGSVSMTFAMGIYEVTNAQYREFLNAVDPNGTNGLSLYNSEMSAQPYGGITLNAGAPVGSKYQLKLNMDMKPVVFVSFYDALRFTNWLNNGQGAASTENGAYTLLGGTATPSNAGSIGRNGSATVFLPSENEWYKSAYYDPGSSGADANGTVDYWLYPTRSDTPPTLATANATGGTNNPGTNVANYNFGADWNGQNGNVTTVGSAGSGSAGFYGTFDQGGNVWEWTDALNANGVTSGNIGLRGGSWDGVHVGLGSFNIDGFSPAGESADVGFRVASVPEPSAAAFLGGGLFCLASIRLRRKLY